jgi:hypothetical protein
VEFAQPLLNDSTLPDDVREEIIRSYVQNRISNGDLSFLDMSLECSKKFVSHFQRILEHCVPADQPRLTSKLTGIYLSQILPPGPSKISHTHTRVWRPPVPSFPSTSGNVTPHEPHLQSCPMKATDTNPTNCEPPPTPGRAWTEHTTTRQVFRNHANALEWVGPCSKSVRTAVSGPLVGQDQFSREISCHTPSCPWRCLVVTPGPSLSSGPATIFVQNGVTHTGHVVVSWHDWYSYRAQHNPKNSAWDVNRYKKQPGIPPTIHLQVEKFVSENRRSTFTGCWDHVECNNSANPLLCLDATVRRLLKEQTKSVFRKLVTQVPDGAKLTRVTYFGDIAEYMQRHSVNWKQLLAIDFQPQPIYGDSWLSAVAKQLTFSNVIRPLCLRSGMEHRALIVLDAEEVVHDLRWQALFRAPENKHRTGPSPRDRTLVVTTLALLSNLCWAQKMGWEISASIDGTHKISNSKYILHAFGVNGVGKKGKRSFFPVGYGFGEGEREIVALHTMLNVKIAASRLFGITEFNFKGGLISDRSHALVNGCRVVLTETPLMQCYSHIIRKFKSSSTREGNGDYTRHVSKTKNGVEWLSTVAHEDIRRLYGCKTDKQFRQMWALVRGAWEAAGEKNLAATFHDSYIKDHRFGRWRYNISGIPGCIPDNNPIESHNRLIKGTQDFHGYVTVNQSMTKVLGQELPNLLYKASESQTEPKMERPIVQFSYAFENEEFMKFYEQFDHATDLAPYQEGYLSNDIQFLGSSIGIEEIKRMEAAEEGLLDVGVAERGLLLVATQRFHKLKWVVEETDDVCLSYVQCDCYRYYVHSWCYNAAYLQHLNQLKKEGQKIPTTNRSGRKLSRRAQDRLHLAVAAVRKRQKECVQMATEHLQLPANQHHAAVDGGPAVLTQD